MLPIFFSLSNVKFNYILGFSDIFRHNNADFEYCNIIWTQISPEFTSIQVSQFQRPFFARVRWHLLFRFPMQSFNIRPNFDPNCRQVHEHANKVLFPIPFPFQPPCLHLLSKFPMQGLLSKFPMQGGEHSNQMLTQFLSLFNPPDNILCQHQGQNFSCMVFCQYFPYRVLGRNFPCRVVSILTKC